MNNPMGNTVSEVRASKQQQELDVLEVVCFADRLNRGQPVHYAAVRAAIDRLEAIAKATGTTDTHRDSVTEQRAEGK